MNFSITIIVLVSAKGHLIVAGIYNYLFLYSFHDIFAHSKHLHSLLFVTFYKTTPYLGSVLRGTP